MQERGFEIEYQDLSGSDETYDVSFTVDEDTEDLLFSGIAAEVADDARSGVLNGATVHLYQQMASQYESHMPWVDYDVDERTYDLELDGSMYGRFTQVVGNLLSGLFGPEASERYRKVVDVWLAVTDQVDVHQQTPEPDHETFDCIVRDGNFRKHSDSGSSWYVCRDCGDTFAELPDEPPCQSELTEGHR